MGSKEQQQQQQQAIADEEEEKRVAALAATPRWKGIARLANLASLGRAVQVDNIKTRVESAYGINA